MYLTTPQWETLLLIRSGVFKQTDIARLRGCVKSVTHGHCQDLAKLGYINLSDVGIATITESGLESTKDMALLRGQAMNNPGGKKKVSAAYACSHHPYKNVVLILSKLEKD